MKRIKKIIQMGCLMAGVLMLSACQVNPETNYIFSPISERIEQNKESIEKLYNADIIDKTTYDKVIEALNTKNEDVENLQKQLKDAGIKELQSLQEDGTLKQILGSVSGFWDVGYDEVQQEYSNKDNFDGAVLTALLKDYQGQVNLYDNLNTDGKVQQPFEILDDSMEETIKTSEKGKVYIIDMQKVQGLSEGGEAGTSIDQLNKYMNCYVSIMNDLRTQGSTEITLPDGTKVDEETFDNALENVFSVLKDSEGNDVQWIDLQTFDVIQEQKEVGPLGAQGAQSSYQTRSGGLVLNEGYENTPGNDIVIQNQVKNKDGNSNNINIMTIRTEELNDAVIDEMVAEVNDGSSQRMLIYNGNLYLFAYPIAVVDQVKLGENDEYTIEYKVDDQVLVSFKSQTILKSNGTQDVQTNNENPYISVGNGDIRDFQQFILSDGTLTTEMNLAGNGTGSQNGENTQSNVPVFILRDYLEGTFTPGVLNDGEIDETIVCYGRLIRLKLKNQSGATYNRNDPIGYYINQEHEKISATGFQDIYVNQLADGSQLKNSVQIGNTVKRLPQTLENIGNNVAGDSSADQVQKLPVEIVQEIHPVLQFPGDLDAWDKDMSNKPQMYTVVTNLDTEQSGLLSHWITSDDEKLSLVWWQQYLNEKGYNYKLTAEAVNKWLNVTYEIQISDKDYVIFDMDKIETQNSIFQEGYNRKITQRMRAMLLVFGWILEIWGGFLLIAWVYDTNIGVGVKLLERLSFRKMTAIKYEDEGEYYQKDGPIPVTLQKLIVRIIILMVTGIVIMNVDVFNIMKNLMILLGNMAKILEDLITGEAGAISNVISKYH